MDKNLIGEDGAQAFAEAIEHNKTLLCLSLESNLIGAKGAKAFAEVLELDRNRMLQNLYLGDNPLGEDGVCSLLWNMATLSYMVCGYRHTYCPQTH